MARFDTSGLDEVLRQMERMNQQTGEAATAMLQAGAEQVKEAWRTAARMHKHRDTGDMIESIGFAREPKQAGGVKYIDIYPQGKDSHGERNAKVAFVLHYGTSKRPGSRWIDDADRISGETAVPAMVDIWRKYVETGQVPHVELTPNHPSGHDGGGITTKKN